MPKCKYDNYRMFLETHFDIITSKNDFYDKNEIVYRCRSKSHLNRLGVTSFANKKSKCSIEHFCQGCKDEHENLDKRREFISRICDKTGHIIIDVNFSTRKVHYQCGNCSEITQSFTQNFNDATPFCLKCQNDKYKIPFDTLKEKVESYGFRLLTLSSEYQNNKQKLKVLCVCGKPHQSILSDIVRGKHCGECKLKKYESTCMVRYGVRNVSQDPVIFEKIVKKSYTGKKYNFKSGKVLRIQGYEGFAIDDLLDEKISEHDLFFGKDIPSFSYIDDNNIQHVYHPDIFVKSLNLIVEVKSDYTYTKELRKNYLKFCKVVETGYRLRIMIYNDKFESVKDITIQSVDELLENFLE
jgi:hypothetical protein